MTPQRTIEFIADAPPPRWVGDGFPVSTLFSPQTPESGFSPFLLLDYAGPAEFAPSAEPRGVGAHPHRGFETVTIVYQGELHHRDSAGNSGTIGPGDVQWMTAGAGLLHEEKHSEAFTRRGGVLEVAQLWVNLPTAHKLTTPRYQEIPTAAIPRLPLGDGAGFLRPIAGDFGEHPGVARTFSPLLLWDVHLAAGASIVLPIRDGFNAAVFVRRGEVVLAHDAAVTERRLAVLSRWGGGVAVRSEAGADLLVMGGAPLDGPVVAYGPFVMNTSEQIRAAIDDLRAGRFGTLN